MNDKNNKKIIMKGVLQGMLKLVPKGKVETTSVFPGKKLVLYLIDYVFAFHLNPQTKVKLHR